MKEILFAEHEVDIYNDSDPVIMQDEGHYIFRAWYNPVTDEIRIENLCYPIENVKEKLEQFYDDWFYDWTIRPDELENLKKIVNMKN